MTRNNVFKIAKKHLCSCLSDLDIENIVDEFVEQSSGNETERDVITWMLNNG